MGATGQASAPSTNTSSGTGFDASNTAGALLLSIPAVELHQVASGKESLLERGPMTIAVVDRAAAVPPPQSPLPPAQPAGKQGLYPSVYQQAGGSESGSDSEASAGAPGSSIVVAVGGQAWELLPASQTLKVGATSFVFSTPEENTFYAVTVSADTGEEALGMLEAILESVTLYRESEALLGDAEVAAGDAALAERTAYKSRLAQGVHSASRTLASGLLATATYASGGISKGAAYLTPQEPTATPLAVPPGLRNRLRQTSCLAARIAGLASSVVGGLAWAGAKVAGGVLWLAGADKPLKAGEEAGMLREVGHAAVSGFTEVWDSMEEAGKTVLLAARDNTAGVVRQRYGEEASEASMHSMNTAGYGADAFWSTRKLGVKTVAKSAAKRTARGVLHTWAGNPPPPGGASSASASSAASSRAGSAGSLERPGAGGAPAGKGGSASNLGPTTVGGGSQSAFEAGNTGTAAPYHTVPMGQAAAKVEAL